MCSRWERKEESFPIGVTPGALHAPANGPGNEERADTMRYIICGIGAVLVVAGLFVGCPKPPNPEPAMAVSEKTHHFWGDPITGEFVTEWSFRVWNTGDPDTELVFDVTPLEDWINVSPFRGTSHGAGDPVQVNVTIDRAYSDLRKEVPEFATGSISVRSRVGEEIITVTTSPDYYTEIFNDFTNNAIDLDGVALQFAPDGGLSYYGIRKAEDVTEFPTDPAGALLLDFSISDPFEITLPSGWMLPFYGVGYNKLYISSNGYVAFGGPGRRPTTIGDHFASPQISALPVDAALDPETAMVSFGLDAERAYITFENSLSLPDDANGLNDFQIELFFDETIRLTYLNIDPLVTGLVGLSVGGSDGIHPPQEDFVRSDLTDANTGPILAKVAW